MFIFGVHNSKNEDSFLEYLSEFYIPCYRNEHEHLGQTNKTDRNIIMGKVTQMRSEEDMMGKKIEAYWARTDDWFFKWNLTTKTIGLYDMNKDPQNNNNLADTHPEMIEGFKC